VCARVCRHCRTQSTPNPTPPLSHHDACPPVALPLGTGPGISQPAELDLQRRVRGGPSGRHRWPQDPRVRLNRTQPRGFEPTFVYPPLFKRPSGINEPPMVFVLKGCPLKGGGGIVIFLSAPLPHQTPGSLRTSETKHQNPGSNPGALVPLVPCLHQGSS